MRLPTRHLIRIVGIVFVLWAGGALVFVMGIPGESARAEFGNAFQAVNALFAGLAFGGVIVALLLQMQELQLQREELASTRDEVKRTADAQDLMTTLMGKQVDILAAQTRTFNWLEGHAYRQAGVEFRRAQAQMLNIMWRMAAERLSRAEGENRRTIEAQMAKYTRDIEDLFNAIGRPEQWDSNGSRE